MADLKLGTAVGGYLVLHTNNFNIYSPTLIGTGASGTWNISVSGSAGSAGSVTNSVIFTGSGAGDASGTSFNGSAARIISHNTIGAIPYVGATANVDLGVHNLNVDACTLHVNSVTHYVGVGTSAGREKFSVVNGNIGADTGAFVTRKTLGPQVILNHSGSGWGLITNFAAEKWALGYGPDFFTQGTQVLTWTTGGLVGIGNTQPDSLLSINSLVDNVSAITLRFPAGTAGDRLGILFKGNDGTYNINYAELTGGVESWSSDDGFLGFRTSNNTVLATRMRLTSNGTLEVGQNYTGLSATLANGMIVQGNVGIGTTAPSVQLDVSGNVAISSTLTVLGNLLGASNISDSLPSNPGNGMLWFDPSTAILSIYVNNAWVIASKGNPPEPGSKITYSASSPSGTITLGDAWYKSDTSIFYVYNGVSWTKAAQEVLYSGVNIKTINNTSVVGSGNISVAPASGSGNYVQVSPASAQTGGIWMSSIGTFGNEVRTIATTNAALVRNTNSGGDFYLGIDNSNATGLMAAGQSSNYARVINTNSNYPLILGVNNNRVILLNTAKDAIFSNNIEASGTILATTAKLTNLTDGYIPYHISDASGLGNSPIYTDGTNVGIGTTAPGYALDIQPTTGSPSFRIARTGGTEFRIGSSVLASGALVGTYSNSPFTFLTNSTEKMRITETGNVGIGTTVPGSILCLFNSSSTAPLDFANTSALTLQNPYTTAGNTGSAIFFKSDTRGYNTFAGIGGNMQGANANGAYGDIVFGTKATVGATTLSERVRITSTGNVGIGYSTGTEITNNKLAVNGSGYFGGNLTINNTSPSIKLFQPTISEWDIGMTNSGSGNFRMKADGFEVFNLNTGGAATFAATVNSTGYLLNGNNLFSSLSTNAVTKWDGTKLVDASVAPASGSGNYIQNQLSSAQTANMWINGSAIFREISINSDLYIPLILQVPDDSFRQIRWSSPTKEHISYTRDANAGKAFEIVREPINGYTSLMLFKLDVNGAAIFASTIQATTAKLTNLSDGYIPYHISDGSGLGNSILFQNATGIGIGTSPSQKLDVSGGIKSSNGTTGCTMQYNATSKTMDFIFN